MAATDHPILSQVFPNGLEGYVDPAGEAMDGAYRTAQSRQLACCLLGFAASALAWYLIGRLFPEISPLNRVAGYLFFPTIGGAVASNAYWHLAMKPLVEHRRRLLEQALAAWTPGVIEFAAASPALVEILRDLVRQSSDYSLKSHAFVELGHGSEQAVRLVALKIVIQQIEARAHEIDLQRQFELLSSDRRAA